LNQRIYELDAEIRQNQNVLNLSALEADRSENRIAFNRQRAAELAGRHAQVDVELGQATRRPLNGNAKYFADSGGYFVARRIGRFDRSRGGACETRESRAARLPNPKRS